MKWFHERNCYSYSRGLVSWTKSLFFREGKVKVLVTMSRGFAQKTENGSSARETVQSRHCLMLSISQGDVIQVYLHSRYFSFSICSVEQYVKNERDKTVVDLDRDEFVPKEKRE